MTYLGIQLFLIIEGCKDKNLADIWMQLRYYWWNKLTRCCCWYVVEAD